MLTACALDTGGAVPDTAQRNVDTFGSVLTPSASGTAGGYSVYVALGDSYSSANGVPNEGPPCHRSAEAGLEANPPEAAWPHLLYPKLPFQSASKRLVDEACSSATTAGILGPEQGQPPQIDSVKALSAEESASALITITIGGNDVGVSAEIWACINGNCCTPTNCEDNKARILKKIADTRPKLVDTYRELQRAAPNATIVAVGYPRLVASTATASCTGQPAADIDLDERTMIREMVDAMNSTIASAAKDVGVHWITAEVVAAFEGREACAGTGNDFIWNLADAPSLEAVFHPSAAGNRAYGEAVLKGLSARLPSGPAAAPSTAASAAKPGVTANNAKPTPATTTRPVTSMPGTASTPTAKPTPNATPGGGATRPDSQTDEGDEASTTDADSETESDEDAAGGEDEAQEEGVGDDEDETQEDASGYEDETQEDASGYEDETQEDASGYEDETQEDASGYEDETQEDASGYEDEAPEEYAEE